MELPVHRFLPTASCPTARPHRAEPGSILPHPLQPFIHVGEVRSQPSLLEAEHTAPSAFPLQGDALDLTDPRCLPLEPPKELSGRERGPEPPAAPQDLRQVAAVQAGLGLGRPDLAQQSLCGRRGGDPPTPLHPPRAPPGSGEEAPNEKHTPPVLPGPHAPCEVAQPRGRPWPGPAPPTPAPPPAAPANHHPVRPRGGGANDPASRRAGGRGRGKGKEMS